MKQFFTLIFLLSVLSFTTAQELSGNRPPSFRVPGVDAPIETRFLPTPDMAQIQLVDQLDEQNGNPYRIAQHIAAGFSLQNSGTWTNLPDHSGRIWRLDIAVAGAQALIVYCNDWYIPDGCELFLYNSRKDQVIGGFTSAFNTESGTFAFEMIAGDQVILEFYEPAGASEEARISIGEIGYVYRGAEQLIAGFSQYSDKSSGDCEVDVNCSEGAAWQDEKKGVCKIVIKNGGNSFLCSGSLMNNTSNSCTPYVLLADHCTYYNTYASASDLLLWVFYFHYEASTCGGIYTGGQKTKTACTLKAHDTFGSTSTGSDFYLVQLNQTLTIADNVYYNGWSRSAPGSTGVGIHHPDGDLMKISTYTTTPTSSAATRYNVVWAATTNGHGVTEGGSSGSPLFNAAGLVVGTLTGGGSSCTALTSPDYYGKIAYHWTNNGSTADKQLKPWLDPANTGANSLNGSATCIPASINETETLDASVYLFPNPVNEVLHIAFKNNELHNPVIRIYSLMGLLVYEHAFSGILSGELTLDLSGQPSGMYFLSLESSGRTINKKVMIVH